MYDYITFQLSVVQNTILTVDVITLCKSWQKRFFLLAYA